MAKKKKESTVEEGAEVETTDLVMGTPDEPSSEPAPGSAEEERLMEEAVAELVAKPKAPDSNLHVNPPVEMQNPAGEELVKIRFLHTGLLRCFNGTKIAKGETGDVLPFVADAVIGRGHAELV